jgi:M6 family metalloprotease-like protein
MKRLVQVVVICSLMAVAVPCLTSAIDLSKGIILDVPEEVLESQFGKIPISQLSRQDSIDIASYRFIADTLKVLAIMVDWDNRPGTYSRETFDSLLFSRDVFAGWSVADYYHETSYGQVTVVGEVIDWYNAGWYTGWYDFESILWDLDPVIDYSEFDGNNDGDVDAVTFIRSGNGEEDSGNPSDIWSYAYVYAPGTGPGPFDGVYVSRWNTSPETRPLRDSLNPQNFSGVDTLNRIRVFCHELAHCFGLPDLYDYDDKLDTTTYFTPGDYNDHPLVDWCVMGYYGYGIFSIGSDVPSHFCGWSKKEMGWIDPVVLAPGTYRDLVIYNIETTNDSALYLLPIVPEEGEYFFLEYRNRASAGKFDKLDSDFSCYFWPHLTYGCDPMDRGLLITHVHDSLGAPFYINNGTPDYPHYTVVVEDAGYNPIQDAWSNPEGFVTDSAQWWYPYETRKAAPFSDDVSGQQVFGPTTYPNSDGYFGPSGIVVRVDSIVDDKLYAYVSIRAPAIVTASPGQNQLNVPVSTDISATFDRDMDETTMNDSTFVVNARSTGFHQGTISYDSPTKTATFDPLVDFDVGEVVTVVLTTGIQSSEGASLGSSYVWSFTIEVEDGGACFAPDSAYPAGDGPRSVFAADLDGDGDHDLAAVSGNPAELWVLLNNGDGTFTNDSVYMVYYYPFAVFAADLDGDGDLDLAVAIEEGEYMGSVRVLLNNGDGTFAPYSKYSVYGAASSVFAADLDGDGDLDLVSADYFLNGTVSVLLNNGDGSFAPFSNYPVGGGPYSVFAADLDGDGDLDLATANANSPYSDSTVSVLFNNGDGTFGPYSLYPAGDKPVSIFAADLDDDGNLDLATANENSDDVSVLVNNGDGTFAPFSSYPVGGSPFSVFAADFDGDGDLDLSTANQNSHDVSALLNNGDATFATHLAFPVGTNPNSVFAADLDGDGDLDLATVNRGSDNVSVLLNSPRGDCNDDRVIDIADVMFLINYIFLGQSGPEPLCVGDVNCDGAVDVADVMYLINYLFLGGSPPCT